MSFKKIPVLDLSKARDPATKPEFLEELRHALIEVGFMYIRNTGVPQDLFDHVVGEGKAFFDIPLEEKLKIEMKNAPSFLGYSRLAAEITAHRPDQREQIDLATSHPVPGPADPRHHNLLAPNLWPDPELLPQFRPVFKRYIERMSELSMAFTDLIAQAIGLPEGAFDACFDGSRDDGWRGQLHKLKVVMYPEMPAVDGSVAGAGNEDERRAQGVGPHKDSMLSSYLLQASHHRGLQVQNLEGRWVDVPPVDGTLVVAIGQGMEALTRGVCVATSHRVLSPLPGEGPRFSVPFFQGVSLDARFDDLESPQGPGAGVSEAVRQLRADVLERHGGRLDDVEFTFRGGGKADTLGEATLRNRVKSHQDVGQRWFPDILDDILSEARAKGIEVGGGYD